MYLKFYEITTSDKGPFKIALLNLKTRIQACTSSVLITGRKNGFSPMENV